MTVALAPAYDLVDTIAYLPEDSLALTLGGSKSFFASRLHLLAFGERCEVDDARERLRHLLGAAERGLAGAQAHLADAPQLQRAITSALHPFLQTFGS